MASEDVERIVLELSSTQNTRTKYTSKSAVSDIKSALNKYLAYISSNDSVPDVITDISAVLQDVDTTTQTMIETRLGQGKYRSGLIDIWRRCAVTQFDRLDLLVASHIKPWSVSTEVERLDSFNGLLLSPNLDKLFDRGYISFDSNGGIVISPLMNDFDLNRLGIHASMSLYKTVKGCMPYIEFHRNNIFIHDF